VAIVYFIEPKVYDIEPRSPMDNLPIISKGNTPGEPLDREDQFIRNLATHSTQASAAIAAGYSTSYANSTICHKFRSKTFIDKLRTYYSGNAAMLLPKILSAEAQAVDLVNNDITQLPKYRHTLSELKRTSQVLAPEAVATQTTINVNDLRVLMTGAQAGAANDSAIRARIRGGGGSNAGG